MNRRNFLSGLLKATAAFSILPAALTYERTWKAVNGVMVPTPQLIQAEYEFSFLFDPRVFAGEFKLTKGILRAEGPFKTVTYDLTRWANQTQPLERPLAPPTNNPD